MLAAGRGATIFGECGGYMVLGDALVDKDGNSHAMLGLLPHTTSFAARRLHLGYRRVRGRKPFFWDMPLTAHEFHYASIVTEGNAERLFDAQDAMGGDLEPAGLQRGKIAGSFIHIIGQG